MIEVPTDLQAKLRAASATEWSNFVAEVRPPDCREEFRVMAAAFVADPAALDRFTESVDLSRFTNPDGTLDRGRIGDCLNTMFGVRK